MNRLALNHPRWITIFVILLFTQARLFAQPSANFTATPVSGCSPIVVNFSDQSTGNPTQWKWDLGNGVISFLQNPSATYFNPGTYNVKLIVGNATGVDSIVKNQLITVYPNPVVNFKASDTTGCFPLYVQFTDLSTTPSGTITNWVWDFGDGTTSTLPNPSHTYTAIGSFSVTLRITNGFGCIKTFSKTQYIQISDGVKADFTNVSPGQCQAPITINFTNTSTGPAPLSYTWDFGDGTNSIAPNPVHTYNTSGTYTVTLVTVSPQGCRDTVQKQNLISIGTINSQFNRPDSICEGEAVTINNTTTPAPGSVSWDFGDGTFSTDIYPTKTYTSSGTFTIKLVNNFGGCFDSISKSIIVNPLPKPDFTSNPTISCKVPFTVNFTNQTPGTNTYVWNFGDGTTSAASNPVHAYTVPGNYDVTLTAVNVNGCSYTIVKQQIVQIQIPTVSINGLPSIGCVPISINPTATVTSNEAVATYLWDFGDGNTSTVANPTHIYAIAGTYTVTLTVTTISGCIASAIINNAVRIGNKPNADFTVNPTDVCAFQPVTFTDLSTGNVDQWLWKFGDGDISTLQNPTHEYQDTGWFSVTLIVWNNTCPDTLVLTDIVHIRPPIASFTYNRSCSDKYKIDFIDRSIGPTTWQWSFGDGNTSTAQNPSHTYATPGSYSVLLVVTNGPCTHSQQQTIRIIDEKANFVADNSAVCKGTPITFTGININEINITNWFWNMGDGTSFSGPPPLTHAFLVSGTFPVTLTITDIFGCTDTKTINVNIYGPSAQFFPNVPGVCLGTTSVIFADSSKTDGVNPIVKWIWNYGDGTIDSTSPPPYTHLFTNTGIYDVSLTVVDNFGCQNSLTKPSAIVIAQPKADFISPDTLSCVNKPIQFLNTSVGYDLQYLWNFGDGGNGNDVNPVYYYGNTGLYTVNLVITDRYGCKDSINRPNYIDINLPKALFTVSDSVSTCPPMLVTFTNASTNYVSFKWDFGDGNTSILDTPAHYYTLPGIYFANLVVTGQGGCTDTFVQKIEVRGPRGSFTYLPKIGCKPLTVDFTATTLDRLSFIWDYSDGTVFTTTDSIVTHTYTSTGDFVPKMILVDAGGCIVPILGLDTIKVLDVEARFDLNDFEICDSGYVNFNTAAVSNDLITSYDWSFGDGTSSKDQNPSHHYVLPGLFDIQLIVTTQYGCKDTAVLNDTINVYESPVIGILGDSSACVPVQFTFNGEIIRGDSSTLNWQWDFSNGQVFNSQNPPAQDYNNSGAYNIKSVATDIHGCKDSVVKVVNINPLPNTSAGTDALVCRDDSIQLTATGADTYLWNASPDLSCINCPSPLTSPADTAIYIVTGTNQFGCIKSDSVMVTVRQRFTLNVGPGNSICAGATVPLSASGADQYIWSPSAGLDNPNIATPKATPATTTTYTVIAKDNDNCFAITASVLLQVTPLPTVNAGPDQTIEVGTQAQLNATNSNDVISWKWAPGTTLSCINCPDPKAKPKQTTNYFVEVKNSSGCVSLDNMTVFVVCTKGNLFIPNTFSPNGDGMNDKFYPRGSGVAIIRSLMVFNRWGELVFEKSNFNANDLNSGWDGTYKGQKLSPDVYVYACEVVCDNNQIITFKGDITLLK